MNVYLRYCKKCGEAFDINIQYNLCPKCRKKQEEIEDENNRKNKY